MGRASWRPAWLVPSAGPSPVRYGPGNWQKEGQSGTPTPSQPSVSEGGDSTETVSASSSLLSGAARVAEADLVEGRPGDPNRFLKVESKP